MRDNKRHENVYGLIGYPLGHSFSRNFFNQKFESEEINAEYRNFEIPNISLFKEIISKNKDLKGLNVTIPYKEQVIQYLDELDEDARKIGAVNVIKFILDKKNNKCLLKGYNSDIIGFCDSIRPLLKENHTHALILGTGGAAKAVACGLEKFKISSQLVSRNKDNATLTYQELDKSIMLKHHIIINTTPLGMYPHVNECPNIPYDLLTPSHLCYDLLYNPDETLFMKKAKNHGANVKNGLEMLLLQAFAAWEIWQS
ncbi:MAG: shikimate dehydrogenase [Muribaculaceae bacterium]